MPSRLGPIEVERMRRRFAHGDEHAWRVRDANGVSVASGVERTEDDAVSAAVAEARRRGLIRT